MRPRVIVWAGAIARRQSDNPDVHFDTRKRFEIRPLRKNSTKVQLFVAAKEGGPGFSGDPIARYDSVDEAMEAARLSSYPKDNIVPREKRLRRPYRKAVAFVAPKRVTKAAWVNKTADTKPVKTTKRGSNRFAPVVAAKPTAKPKTIVAKAASKKVPEVEVIKKKVRAKQAPVVASKKQVRGGAKQETTTKVAPTPVPARRLGGARKPRAKTADVIAFPTAEVPDEAVAEEPAETRPKPLAAVG